MKRNYVAITLGIVLGASLLGGCGQKATTSEDTGTIYGEVTEVSDDSLTIDVGTMKEQDQKSDDNNSTDSKEATDGTDNSDSKDSTDTQSSDNKEKTSEQSSDDSSSQDNSSDNNNSGDNSSGNNGDAPGGEAPSGEAPSMINLTGEEKEITVSDDTTITKENMGGGPGGAPGGEAPSGDNSGSAPSGDNNGGTPPEKPSDDNSSSDSNSSNNNNSDSNSGDTTGGNAPGGDQQNEEEAIELSDISEGDIVAVTFDDNGKVESIKVISSSMQGGGGQSEAPSSYTAVNEYTEDTEESGKSVKSEGTDENAIHAYEGATVNLSDFTVTRDSSDSQGGDSSSFYGVGAAVLESDGTLNISDSTIETDANGAAGIFAYGDGTVYAADTAISTKGDTSGGIHAAGGGTLYAWDLTATTEGESSAAIRSDRGGGKMVVDGGTYTSNGTGSPAVYSTADIAVNDATLTANGSEAVCIEGLNSLRLFDCDLTGNMSDNEQNDCTWNVILYQSMSGDSEVGNSTFEMNGGTLTAKNGGMFYTTNTESTFTLSDVDITYADDNDFFLRCTGNNNQRGWGTTGENGADCTFTATKQEMKGDIIWDSISQLDFYMTDGSTLTGAVTDDETYAGNGGDGYCNLYIGSGCTWTVTGDSTLSELQNSGTIVDADGHTVTIKGSDGTVYVEGTSEYTITVSSYKTTADTSGATAATSWSDYEVERPSGL